MNRSSYPPALSRHCPHSLQMQSDTLGKGIPVKSRPLIPSISSPSRSPASHAGLSGLTAAIVAAPPREGGEREMPSLLDSSSVEGEGEGLRGVEGGGAAQSCRAEDSEAKEMNDIDPLAAWAACVRKRPPSLPLLFPTLLPTSGSADGCTD